MRAALTTALEVVGLASISAGCWLISPVSGLIAGGSALVLIGWRAS
jgi:hypothetical protein